MSDVLEEKLMASNVCLAHKHSVRTPSYVSRVRHRFIGERYKSSRYYGSTSEWLICFKQEHGAEHVGNGGSMGGIQGGGWVSDG